MSASNAPTPPIIEGIRMLLGFNVKKGHLQKEL